MHESDLLEDVCVNYLSAHSYVGMTYVILCRVLVTFIATLNDKVDNKPLLSHGMQKKKHQSVFSCFSHGSTMGYNYSITTITSFLKLTS